MSEVSFGPFLLDPSSTRLLRDGVEVKLRPQAFQALKTLLRHSGQSIGYEQMMAEAWDGTFVSRHTVDVTIGEVRKSLGEYGRWITHRPKVGYCLEVPASEELVRTGWHYWNRRTRDGADRAIDCFKRAAQECATDFRAFEGLSTCYLMLATFGMRAPSDVYGEFLDAHARAVDAGGLRPELRCNRAHGLHMFEHRLEDAEVEFEQTLRERPTYGTALVRSALLYCHARTTRQGARCARTLFAGRAAPPDAAGDARPRADVARRAGGSHGRGPQGRGAAPVSADLSRQLRDGARMCRASSRRRWSSISSDR